LKLVLAGIGRMRSRELAAVRAEYLKRMQRYAAVEVLEIKEEKGAGRGARGREAARVCKGLRDGDFLVVCDERGRQLSSRQLAGFLAERDRSGPGRTVCLVGGPYGVSDELRERADRLLALSRLTLPHELAQVVLTEALYRAMTITRGEKYHHE